MKKIVTLSLCTLLSMTGFFSTSKVDAKDDLSLQKAKEIVETYLPRHTALIESDYDDTQLELNYYNKDLNEKYEFTLNREDYKILKFESERVNQSSSNHILYSIDDIYDLVSDEIKEIQTSEILLEKDNGLYEYHVYFQNKDGYGKMEINPETGIVLEREIRFDVVGIFEDDQFMRFDEIKQIAEQYVPEGRIKNIVFKRFKSTEAYKILLTKKNHIYLLWLDAKTGEKLSLIEKNPYRYDDVKDEVNPDTTKLSMEEAKEIVLKKAKNGYIVDMELDYDHGRWIYEGELKDGYLEVEFEIDALSGKILDWEREIDD